MAKTQIGRLAEIARETANDFGELAADTSRLFDTIGKTYNGTPPDSLAKAIRSINASAARVEAMAQRAEAFAAEPAPARTAGPGAAYLRGKA